jgi:putative exosortase-associated protein (TIGR04073 family)
MALYKLGGTGNVSKKFTVMRSSLFVAIPLALVAILLVGCKGPNAKLSRGLSDATEFARMGELRRSVEQAGIWDGPSYIGQGFASGMQRSIIRTLVGVYEIATFPIPSYDPIIKPGFVLMPDATTQPAQPDAYKPGLPATGLWDTDTNLGFSGGEVAPIVPGSRFKIFDY